MWDQSIEKLIEEVEKRPALYLKSHKEYSDINYKKLWEEVCTALIENWNGFTPEEKKTEGAIIQKRWSNLRTCFSRELKSQKQTKSGQGAVTRRKYIYFDRLLFLIPDIEQRRTESNVGPREDETENISDCDIADEGTPRHPMLSSLPAKKRRLKKNETYEEQLLQILKEKTTATFVDEDTSFALSLVPTLRFLPEANKLQARTEILIPYKSLNFSLLPACSIKICGGIPLLCFIQHHLHPYTTPVTSSITLFLLTFIQTHGPSLLTK
ncbi:uncharacterized protein LOC111864070 [Cryptotermes secundus]|uniref:uncharacterized protein LOC111864070 n=1 Tax=Cryptotermes secundus TaxID=105785 RepID=UPI000CD7DBB0|nr:uncharacterized protein LOC111864070 [Cryptotermes secundus]